MGHLRDLVKFFRCTQTCGHHFSRLFQIWTWAHPRVRVSPYMKGKSKGQQTKSVISHIFSDVCLSKANTFIEMGVESYCTSTIVQQASDSERLADLEPSYRWTCLTGCTSLEKMNAQAVLRGIFKCFVALLVKHFVLVFALLKAVDYLLIAKPVAINHLRIRCDYALI